MANPQHLKILKQGVEAWNRWSDDQLADLLRRRTGELVKADLTGTELRNADLKDANLIGADLSAADLSGANLWAAKLSFANLHGTNLMAAELTNAGLNGADLSYANLWKARLSYAELWQANLIGASLRGTHLSGTNLRSVELTDTDFSEAVFDSTVCSDLDLSVCKSVGDILHGGPSIIAPSTFEVTALGLEKEPSRLREIEAFYRGTGVHEHLIELYRSRIGKPIEFYSCFISYSHADKSFARRLYADLQAKGIRCWLDEHQMLPGDDIYEMVDRGIRLWDKVLLCCSEASLTSWWVDDEIRKALAKERQLHQERGERFLSIIPLNLDGYLLESWKDGKAQLIKDRLAADFTGWEADNAKFEEQFERVVKALRTGDGGREAPPKSRL